MKPHMTDHGDPVLLLFIRINHVGSFT